MNESDNEVVFTDLQMVGTTATSLIRDYDVKIEGPIALRGTQRIGLGPAAGGNSAPGCSMTAAASPRARF